MEKSADKNSVHYVRCLKCNKILKSSRFDTTVLLDHIRSNHPEIEIIKSVEPTDHGSVDGKSSTLTKQESSTERVTNQATYTIADTSKIEEVQIDDIHESNLPEIKRCSSSHSSETKILYSRRYKVKTPSMCASQHPNKNNLYKASVEKWQPGNGTIYCPKCSSNKRPILKSRSERFTYNSCGACCILGCWPFCFLPCLFPGQNMEYLYCSNCKTFLGLYDRDCNCLKPNREYVNSKQNHESKEIKDTTDMPDSKQAKPTATKEDKNVNPYTCKATKDFKEVPDYKDMKCPKSAALTHKYLSNANKKDCKDQDLKDSDIDTERYTADGRPVNSEEVKRFSKYGKWNDLDVNHLAEDDQDRNKANYSNY